MVELLREKSISCYLEAMHHPLRWLAFLGISLLMFMGYLDITIVNTALPYIQQAFKASVLQLQWVSNIFSMLVAVTMIVMGRFADLFGRRKIFFLGVILFTLAAWGAGASTEMGWLIFFRAMQGLGVSCLYVSSTALLSDIFPADEHAKAVSLYVGITGAGLMLGPTIGGILVGLLSWRWVFWINLPTVVIGLLMCFSTMRKMPPEKKPEGDFTIDWNGLWLLVVGLGSLVYGIITGAESGWSQLTAWVPLVVGIATLTTLVFVEEKVSAPLLELRIFREKLILLSGLSCIVGGFVSRVFMFFDPLYLQTERGASPFSLGFLISVIPAGQVLISFCFAWLLKRFGVGNLLVISIGSALVSAIAHLGFSATMPVSWVIGPFFLLGLNWGLSNTCLMTSVNQTVPANKRAKVMGMAASLWNIIGVVFLAVDSAVFHVVGKGDLFLMGFHAVAWVNAVVILVVFAGAVWVRLRQAR